MSEEKDIIDLGDKCKLEFSKDGNIKILGDCDNKTINRIEIALFDKVSNVIEDEDEV